MVNGVRNFMTGDSDGPVRKPSWNSSTFFLLFFSGLFSQPKDWM
jgi:hypothetical protein